MKKIALLLLVMVWCVKLYSQTAEQWRKQGYVRAVIVDKRGLDGCGFMAMLADSTKLEVIGLPDAFKKKGLKVWIKYRVDKQPVMSTCMAGKVVQLVDIKKRKLHKKKTNTNKK